MELNDRTDTWLEMGILTAILQIDIMARKTKTKVERDNIDNSITILIYVCHEIPEWVVLSM